MPKLKRKRIRKEKRDVKRVLRMIREIQHSVDVTALMVKNCALRLELYELRAQATPVDVSDNCEVDCSDVEADLREICAQIYAVEQAKARLN